MANGCKIHSIELMKSFLTRNKLDLVTKKKKLMLGAKPNFEMIFQNGNSTSIVTLKNAIGIEKTLKLFVLMLEDLVNYFNVSRPMNEDQIAELAVEMIEEMRDLTFEEIVAFIEGIKREEYGKIYERFDAPTFWKFYWGENADDPNSFNFKKMDFCSMDANRYSTKDPILLSDLEQALTKPRESREAVESFINTVGKFKKNPESL